MPRKLTVVKPRTDPAIASLVDEYLTSCRARGLSPKTVNEGYGYPLRSVFLPFCAAQRINEPSQLTPKLLDRLTSHLLTEGGTRGPLSKHSVDSYVRAVNHFLGWLHQRGDVEATLKAQTPKLPRRLVDVLSKQEIQALEDAAQTERDKLIVRLLADTGLRLGELVGLRTTDVVMRGRQAYLHVRGKGESDRLVAIPGLQHRVERFMQHGRPKDSLSDHLFLASRRRGSSGYEALTTRGVHQLIRTLAQKVQLGKRVYPHLLRHSFATRALAEGMNPIQLANILGHRSLVMIQNVYAHLSPSDSYAAMEKLLFTEDRA